MVKEDQYIENRFGKVRPFRVPDGYFDSFADHIMAELPRQEAKIVSIHHTVWYRMRPAFVAAAGVLATVLTATLFFNRPIAERNEKGMAPEIQADANMGISTVDQAAYYSMLDNEDIYALVADE